MNVYNIYIYHIILYIISTYITYLVVFSTSATQNHVAMRICQDVGEYMPQARARPPENLT